MSKSSNQKYKALNNEQPSDLKNFGTVLLYCSLIIFSPIVAFFGTKQYYFDDHFGKDSIKANIYSAACAVLALHLALALYIYRAYRHGRVEKRPQAQKVD